MDNIDLVFICNEFQTIYYIPKIKLKKISDVNDWLWEIYGERIKKHIMENVITGILLDRKDRLPLLRFEYIDQQNGMYVSISYSEYSLLN